MIFNLFLVIVFCYDPLQLFGRINFVIFNTALCLQLTLTSTTMLITAITMHEAILKSLNKRLLFQVEFVIAVFIFIPLLVTNFFAYWFTIRLKGDFLILIIASGILALLFQLNVGVYFSITKFTIIKELSTFIDRPKKLNFNHRICRMKQQLFLFLLALIFFSTSLVYLSVQSSRKENLILSLFMTTMSSSLTEIELIKSFKVLERKHKKVGVQMAAR